ncbi:MAG: hypothetical protein Q4B58_00605 [Bacteroidales bacterium]|nr:hypothetical protein [Bacteroidales bacterium]
MKINKLTYPLPALLSLLVAACVDTYPGITEDMSGTNIVDSAGMNDTVMVHEEFKLISVGINDPSYYTVSTDTSLTSRGMGSFDYLRKDSLRSLMWDSARFMLYAFRDDTLGINFKVTNSEDSAACLLDKVPMWVADPSSNLLSYVIDEEHDGRHLWINKNPETPYRFWSYYIDNVDSLVEERTSEHIKLSFTIDGSQDILAGTAEMTTKQWNKVKNDDSLNTLYTKYLLQGRPMRNLYSTTSALNDIIPIINYKHQLVRFKFELYPGNKESDKMIIDSIKVLTRTHGHLVVASNESKESVCTFDATPTEWVNLPEWNNKSTLDSARYINRWDPKYEVDGTRVYHRKCLKVGESLLIPPTDSLRIQLFARQQIGDTLVDPYQHINGGNIVTMRYAKGFKAGNLYTIRVVLYGEKPYTADAVLSGWEPGVDIVTNPEDENFKPW